MRFHTRRSLALKAIGIAAALLVAAPPSSHAEPWNTPYDKFFEAPGAEVTTSTQADSTEVRRVITPGGVEVRQFRKEGKVRTVLMDDSGYGPVLCVWEIYVNVKHFLDMCLPGEHDRAADRLRMAINRMNLFISENSLDPVSIDEIEASVERRRREAQQITQRTNWQLRCKSGEGAEFVGRLVNSIEKKSDKEFQDWLNKFLSMSRLPVMNPCL